jgi:hypothetical protein
MPEGSETGAQPEAGDDAAVNKSQQEQAEDQKGEEDHLVDDKDKSVTDPYHR